MAWCLGIGVMVICRTHSVHHVTRHCNDEGVLQTDRQTDSQQAAVIASPGNVFIDGDRNNFPDPNSG
jgi:hypothetical protein